MPTSTSPLKRLVAATSIVCAIIAAGGSKPARNAPPPADAPAPVAGSGAKQGNLEHLATWVGAARKTYERVRDYQCTFTKRERLDGTLQDEQTAQMKVRVRPFSVYVKFASPRAVAGKEGSFVQGRNNGKMRAKSGGALSLVGFVTLDPRDPKAMHGTRHSITEAGIGNLIERLTLAVAPTPGAVRQEPTVLVSEYLVAKRACVRFDITDPTADGLANHPRTVVYFDKDTNLPVRYEAYDARGDLVEMFTYTELKFNVGLTDTAFP